MCCEFIEMKMVPFHNECIRIDKSLIPVKSLSFCRRSSDLQMKRKFGLRFFKPTESYSGNWSILEEKDRTWEDMYRGRWSHDKVVRTTHGVNCTGSCSWKVFVKNGIITWENQQIDYPSCGPDMPEFEPRGTHYFRRGN